MQSCVESAHEDSVDSLCELFCDVFQQRISPSEWRWKYLDAALLGHQNTVLRDDSGNVVGHAGAIILPGYIGGTAVPVAQICDVMLAKANRGEAGPAGPYAVIMSKLFSQLRGQIPDGVYYGFPGRRPFRLGERLGFYRGAGAIVEFRIRISDFPQTIWPGWRISRMGWDDPRLDRLWHERPAIHPGFIVLDRTYLSWRYARHPSRSYGIFGVYSGPRLVGWIAVAKFGDILRCVDRILDDRNLDVVLRLLARYANAAGAQEVAWWAPPAAPRPSGATLIETGSVGAVVTASSPRFATWNPVWQPGNADLY